jgi:hypothetical protein
MNFPALQISVGAVFSLHRGYFTKGFTPELFLIRRSLVHVKVCLHMIKHLPECLGERAEKLKVALLEPLSTNINQK